MCGSKTYRCDKCDEWVKMMDKESHVNNLECEFALERKKEREEAET